MRRIWLAIRTFFLVLFCRDVAEQARELLQRRKGFRARAAEQAPPEKPKPTPSPKAKAPARSEAITLLATLQREARFVDFVQEPLGGYSDAKIGAAARDVHRDCRKVLDRLFDLKPLRPEPEGAEVEVPVGFDAGRCRLTGNVSGDPPFRGKLIHPGWEATRCELPTWSGSAEAARVVAPVEVEVKGRV